MTKVPVLPEGFGRAAEKLADTVGHVIDIAVGPKRIRARAQAQADAAIILAEGRAEVHRIEARAVERLRRREARRQLNIEAITEKAFDALPPPETVSHEKVSADWTSRFFEECQDIGDEQMQQIWARILAREVTSPGSFAPRTLSVVRDLTKEDANFFVKVCEFVWFVPGMGLTPVIHNIEAPHVTGARLTFGALSHLTTIGLIQFNGIAGFSFDEPLAEVAPAYHGKAHQLKSDGGQKRLLDVGHVIFTATGLELAKIANAPENSDACR
jgi:Protein of unknown function (DUF2806)